MSFYDLVFDCYSDGLSKQMRKLLNVCMATGNNPVNMDLEDRKNKKHIINTIQIKNMTHNQVPQ
jgi:hypothetical protein